MACAVGRYQGFVLALGIKLLAMPTSKDTMTVKAQLPARLGPKPSALLGWQKPIPGHGWCRACIVDTSGASSGHWSIPIHRFLGFKTSDAPGWRTQTGWCLPGRGALQGAS